MMAPLRAVDLDELLTLIAPTPFTYFLEGYFERVRLMVDRDCQQFFD